MDRDSPLLGGAEVNQSNQTRVGNPSKHPQFAKVFIESDENAVFAAGMSFIDASAGSSRNVVQQWTEAMRQAQQATMDVWQAGVRAGDGLLASAASGEMSGQEDTRQKRQ